MKKRNKSQVEKPHTQEERYQHPLLPECVRAAGPFSELFLAEVLPTLAAWRPGAELVQEHALLHQLYASVGDPGTLLPQVIARALEHLGHTPDFSARPNVPFLSRTQGQEPLVVVLATAYQEDLSPMTSVLHRAMISHHCVWGILTNGVLWQLHYFPTSGALYAPYEVAPRSLLQAAFFSEPFRYFSLFFRAASFTQFLPTALSGSLATESASLQALVSRAQVSRQELLQHQVTLAHLPRALFAVIAAAKGLAPFPEIVQRARAAAPNAAQFLCVYPPPANGVKLDANWLARIIARLTPEDESDPSGLRDARLRQAAPFAPLCSDILRDTDHSWQPQADVASWILQHLKPATSIFELTAECPEQYSALLSSLAVASYLATLRREANGGSFTAAIQEQAPRFFSLTPEPWQADAARLAFWLQGVRDEKILAQLRFGKLGIDTKARLLQSSKNQASLFENAAQGFIERATLAQDSEWLKALSDALYAQQSEAFGGYETLLSLVQTPPKLLSQTSLVAVSEWSEANGVFHWWISAEHLTEKACLFLVSGIDASISRYLSLCKEPMLLARTSGGIIRRQNSSAQRKQVLQEASLLAILSLPNQIDLVFLTPKQRIAGRQIKFSTVSGEHSLIESAVPEDNFLQHPGTPWTPLRSSRALALAARIQARSQPLRELLLAAEPGALFIGEDHLSLQPLTGFLSYQLQGTTYHPGYLLACSLSMALRFVLKVEEFSLLSLPIPKVRFQLTPEQRADEMAEVRPLLLAGRADAALRLVAQKLSKGIEDLAHDLLAESAVTGHCIDTLPQSIFSLLFGLSEEEANLISTYSQTPSLSFVAKPLPVHIPAVKIEASQRELLLLAFIEKKMMTSHEAQGVTGLDSRRLRQLLTDLELSKEITRTGRGSGTLYHYRAR
jgi:hypothetical protein